MGYVYDFRDRSVMNNQMGRYKTRRQWAFIQEWVRGESILDIGGGNGRLAIPLSRQGRKVTVIDHSKEAIELLAREGHSNVDCVHGDVRYYDPPQRYDAALAVDCVKYIEADLAWLFGRFASFLNPGGVLVFTDMNTASWRTLGRHVVRRGRRYNISDLKGYRTALESAGFRVAGTRGYFWMPFLFNSDSPLVPFFDGVEQALSLGSWVHQSPWLMIAGQRNQGPHA